MIVKINGQTKQDGSTSDMIFKIPQLIEHVSSIMTLEVWLFLYKFPTTNTQRYTSEKQEGDLLLTGTPSGVGPVQPGDNVLCALKDAEGKELLKLEFNAVQRERGYQFVLDS